MFVSCCSHCGYIYYLHIYMFTYLYLFTQPAMMGLLLLGLKLEMEPNLREVSQSQSRTSLLVECGYYHFHI